MAEFLEARTTLSKTDIIATLTGLQDAVLFFNLQGRGVKLEGLGTYLPNINYQGEIDAAHRLDRRLKRGLNTNSFSGKIRNKRNIGKTSQQIVDLWNAENPENPVLY